MEQPARHGLVKVRDAVSTFGVLAGVAVFTLGFVEVDKVTDEQVEPPIVVVVEPDRTGAPTGSCDPSFLGHVSECAIAIVVVENAAPVLRDVEVGKTIPVVVAD